MTLRLVNDNERAAIPCRIVTGHGPADVLVSVDGKPYLPACDSCARWLYDRQHITGMAPLDGYVDMYEAARQAALATPGQVTGQQDTYWVFRRMYEDRVIYCRMKWCTDARRLTPADLCVSTDGQPWHASCASCAREAQGDRVSIWQIGETEKGQIWELVGEIAGNRCWARADAKDAGHETAVSAPAEPANEPAPGAQPRPAKYLPINNFDF